MNKHLERAECIANEWADPIDYKEAKVYLKTYMSCLRKGGNFDCWLLDDYCSNFTKNLTKEERVKLLKYAQCLYNFKHI